MARRIEYYFLVEFVTPEHRRFRQEYTIEARNQLEAETQLKAQIRIPYPNCEYHIVARRERRFEGDWSIGTDRVREDGSRFNTQNGEFAFRVRIKTPDRGLVHLEKTVKAPHLNAAEFILKSELSVPYPNAQITILSRRRLS